MTEPTPAIPPMPPQRPKEPFARKPFLVGLATGLAAGGLAVGAVLLTQGDSEDSGPAASTQAASSSPSATTEAPATQEATEVYNPAPGTSDFAAELKTTSKQCFGSAGCNVTVEPKMSYSGLLPLDPEKTYSITYEVRGGQDGAVIQTMELSNQTDLSYRPTLVSTSSSGAKLTIKVTDVEEQG